MKRLILGTGLLLALFAGSLAVWWGMEAKHRPVAERLTLAAVLSASGDGTAARETAFQARTQWQENWHFTAAFADHTPMEEIDDLFRALDAYDPVSDEFAACCLQLSQRTQAMAEAHKLNWWSLL